MRDATPPRGHFLNIVTVGWRGEEGLHCPHCYITAISLAMARTHFAFSTFSLFHFNASSRCTPPHEQKSGD